MKARLLADADLKVAIVAGLRRKITSVDFLRAPDVRPESLPDPRVLALAAELRRVLVSHDRRTMPRHFYRFVQTSESPGVILIRQRLSIGMAIQALHEIWIETEASQFRNQIVYLPR